LEDREAFAYPADSIKQLWNAREDYMLGRDDLGQLEELDEDGAPLGTLIVYIVGAEADDDHDQNCAQFSHDSEPEPTTD